MEISNSMAQIIGYFNQSIIELLHLNIPNNTPIFLGESNIEKIIKSCIIKLQRHKLC